MSTRNHMRTRLALLLASGLLLWGCTTGVSVRYRQNADQKVDQFQEDMASLLAGYPGAEELRVRTDSDILVRFTTADTEAVVVDYYHQRLLDQGFVVEPGAPLPAYQRAGCPKYRLYIDAGLTAPGEVRIQMMIYPC